MNRLLEEQTALKQAKLEALRAAIKAGIDSGPGRPLEDVAANVKSRYRHWAEEGAPPSVV